jgi:hypothetical protein
MKRLWLGLLLVGLCAGPSWAATVTNPGGSGGSGGGLAATAIDTSQELRAIVTDAIGQGPLVFATGATMANVAVRSSLNVPNSTTLPATCNTGDLYMDTDATTGQRFYLCQSANTWAIQGDGIGMATAAIASSAGLGAIVTDKIGTGRLVFGSSPTLTTPNLGIPSAIFLTNAASMPATGITGTLGVGNGGTGSTSYTGGRCVQVNAGGTAFISASGACGTAASGASSVGASGVVQGADGSGGLVATGCSIISGQLTCPGGFVAGTSALGVIAMLQGAATVAGATTGMHNLWIDQTDGVLHSFAYGAATAATYMTTTTSATFQNKTMILGSGNGNIFRAMRTLFFPMAGCSGTQAGPVWDLPASNAATAACVTGTNTQKGVLNFSDNADQSAQITYQLPPMWTGSVPATIAWLTAATSGNVRWYLQTACTPQGSTDDPSFNASSASNTVTKTAQGTTLQVSFATIPAVTMTGCTPNSLLHVMARRVASDAADTLASTASAISVQLGIEETYR